MGDDRRFWAMRVFPVAAARVLAVSAVRHPQHATPRFSRACGKRQLPRRAGDTSRCLEEGERILNAFGPPFTFKLPT